MRLLIITQSVDSREFVPLLFFVGWLREFGKQCENVEVIAQRTGEYDLPENVRVHSLGKERGVPRVFQVLRAWQLMWTLRKRYDCVLVHMTPVWVVLGWKIWFLLRKPVYLWYEARGSHPIVRLGVFFAKNVFSASRGGLPIKTKKNIITGHGIDTTFFSFGEGARDPHLILTLGRITNAKRLDTIIRAFAKLPKRYQLRNIGAVITERDRETRKELDALIARLDLGDRVTFETVSDDTLRSRLQSATLLLHASERTSLDKAVLQAMACGCLVVTSSPVVKPCIPEMCRCTPETMNAVVQRLLAQSSEELSVHRRALRTIIERTHSLSDLVKTLIRHMSIVR